MFKSTRISLPMLGLLSMAGLYMGLKSRTLLLKRDQSVAGADGTRDYRVAIDRSGGGI